MYNAMPLMVVSLAFFHAYAAHTGDEKYEERHPRLHIDECAEKKIYGILDLLFPEATFYLFGSRAAQAFDETSDIDLAIKSSEPISQSRMHEARTLLKVLHIPHSVDLIDLLFVSEEQRRGILENESLEQQFALMKPQVMTVSAQLTRYLLVHSLETDARQQQLIADAIIQKTLFLVKDFTRTTKFYVKKVLQERIASEEMIVAPLARALLTHGVIDHEQFTRLLGIPELAKQLNTYCHDGTIKPDFYQIARANYLIRNVVKKLTL